MGGRTSSIAPFPFPAPQSFECGGDSPGRPTAEWKGTPPHPPPASLLCVGALSLLSPKVYPPTPLHH